MASRISWKGSYKAIALCSLIISLLLFYGMQSVRDYIYPKESTESYVKFIFEGNGPLRRSKQAMHSPPDIAMKLEAQSNKSLPSMKDLNMNNMVFVTATDYSHLGEARDSIASIQEHLPGQKIIFYDLGLWWNSYVKEVKSWCGVTYRKFDFSKYPAHVRSLYKYAWKPLIIQEVLETNNVIIWFDSSIRFNCKEILHEISLMLSKSGIALNDVTGHSIFAATEPNMLNYISSQEDPLKKIPMMGANFIALANTKPLYDRVIKWWVLCSLTEHCIAPRDATLYCHFGEDKFRTYANCHRFDQSALNLLLVNHFAGDIEQYFKSHKSCIDVKRKVTSYYDNKIC